MGNPIHIILAGNPNTGKTSLFNTLTGLHQKTGNYPGITVDKKQGSFHLDNGQKATIIDLPGTYSLNPTSIDESVATKYLLENNSDLVVVVAEVENLKRNQLVYTRSEERRVGKECR